MQSDALIRLDVNDDADVKVNSNYLALTVGILF